MKFSPCPHCQRLEQALEQLGAEILSDGALRVKHRTMFIEFINQQMRREIDELRIENERLKKQ
jgi:hypothetical protein